MNLGKILEYLSDLEAHNNRDWYHTNKGLYQTANHEFEMMIEQLIMELQKFDHSIPSIQPKELTFKLVRDTRFSHDKSPYNPAFRAHIGPKGKLPIPVGYFLMLQPGGRSFLGGGMFADMFKEATNMIRNYIVIHGREWDKIITAPNFTELFTIKGTSLKNVPKGYAFDHPQAEFLKHKSWYLEYPVSDKQVMEKDFLNLVTSIFMQIKDFNCFLNNALVDFQMPAR